MIWLPDNENFDLDKLCHHNANKKIWQEDLCQFRVVPTQPNTLCGWIAGQETILERLPEKEIAAECTKLLRQFMADPNIPEPKSIHRFIFFFINCYMNFILNFLLSLKGQNGIPINIQKVHIVLYHLALILKKISNI
jgi:hypothetical protein